MIGKVVPTEVAGKVAEEVVSEAAGASSTSRSLVPEALADLSGVVVPTSPVAPAEVSEEMNEFAAESAGEWASRSEQQE